MHQYVWCVGVCVCACVSRYGAIHVLLEKPNKFQGWASVIEQPPTDGQRTSLQIPAEFELTSNQPPK
jgi:hypothetical protein